jgi:hypothetical protein
MTYTATTVLARRTLLDALQALEAQRDALVLLGAQAVYLYTGQADVPIATQTKDSDLAVIPADLHDAPTLDDAMRAAGFLHDVTEHQPGAWLSPDGIPVELLVPAALHRGGGRGGARIPPHSMRAARTVPGLEAAAVHHRRHTISALDPADGRRVAANVASPAALVVAKVHKIGERHDRDPGRLLDKEPMISTASCAPSTPTRSPMASLVSAPTAPAPPSPATPSAGSAISPPPPPHSSRRWPDAPSRTSATRRSWRRPRGR